VEGGEEVQQKSIVLLRNENPSLPIEKQIKIYFEDYLNNFCLMVKGAGTVFYKT
jgi:hypothetical protein